MDHLWYDKDPWQTEIANRLQRFYCEEQREHWDGVFLIDGTRLEEKALHPVAIVAVNAQASLAADDIMIISCTCLPCWHFREITEFTNKESGT